MRLLPVSLLAGLQPSKRVAALVLALAAAAAIPARAALIELTFDFSGGFSVSKNGGAAAASGPLVFNLTVDNTTPDLDASADRGRFALSSITLTASSLGIVNQAVVSPSPLYVDTFFSGMTIIGTGFSPDIGWNGGPAPSTFMADVNNLSTLPLPTSITMTSTFFLQSITLANSDTLSASLGRNGPDGTFSARLANTNGRVPDSSATLPLLLGSVMLMVAVSRRRNAVAA